MNADSRQNIAGMTQFQLRLHACLLMNELKMKTDMPKKNFGFQETTRDAKTPARTGVVHTAHGSFETPVFMPVGTQGSVKGIAPRDLEDAGAEILLGNAYHLYIRPGIDIIQKAGGLHKFMGWNHPILTDSGGYQVFSLARLREISEEGVHFQSHFDGNKIFLSPERVIEIQEAIGSDIAMIFDDCPPPTQDKDRIRQSLEITLRWSARAKAHHRRTDQALFGIVQGGIFPDLRMESLKRTVEMDFDGYALGGLCVGEDKTDTLRIFHEITPALPADKPRYLMGVGTPLDFIEGVAGGADMFDCVTPTRYGRNGSAFTSAGLIVVRNGKYAEDNRPLAEDCDCYACRNFSRAYLRHLLNAEEMLGPQLVSLHNIHYFVNLLKAIRQSIREGRFSDLREKITKQFNPDSR